MKTLKRTSNLCLQFFFLLTAGLLQAQWSVAHLSEARDHITSVKAGDYVLFATGFTQDGGTNVVDLYNVSTNGWTVHHLPYISENYTVSKEMVAFGNKVFFVNTSAPTDEIQVFDAGFNNWSAMHLSEARGYISIGVAGEYVVFAGGLLAGEAFSSTVDLYHVPTGTWQVAQMTVPRAFVAITGLNSKVFLAGGYDSYTTLSDRVDVLNTSTWTRDTHTLVVPRAVIEAVTVGNKVLLAGGGLIDDFDPYNEVDIYDGDADTWLSAAMVQYDYSGKLESALVGNKVYFHGGYGPAIFDVYDADGGHWSTIDLPTDHALGAFTSAENNLYLAGGLNFEGNVVERYDCINGTWDTLGFLSESRYRVCGASIGNKLLFAGGCHMGAVSNVVDVFTGISNTAFFPSADHLLAPYPNPTSGMLYIPLPVDATILSVFDMQGKLALTSVVDHIPVKEIFTGNLSPGFYLISVEGADRVYWAKFEVQ